MKYNNSTSTMKNDISAIASELIRSPRARTASLGLGSSQTSTPRKRKSASLPTETVEYLKNWIMSPEHIAHPYPTEQEKLHIMKETGIEMKQLTNWFVNNRKRFWKPRVEAKLREQRKTGGKAEKKKPQSLQLNNISLGDKFSAVSQPGTTTDSTPILPNACLPPLVSPGRVISAQSSVASSEPGYLTGSESLEDLFAAGQGTEEVVVKSETITVHIIRPVGGEPPSMEDVSVLTNVPIERILRSYDGCVLSYRCNSIEVSDPKKVQSKRDAEIVRMKRSLLKKYLSERDAEVLASSLKRRRVEEDTQPYPRLQFRRKSVELWKEACQTADNVFSNSLPSLEEASNLFGYKTTAV